MNELIKKLAIKSYDTTFIKCKEVEYKVGEVDGVFTGYAMQEMHNLTVKECIQKLIDHGYDDAANCLTKELINENSN
jgi:hypothetical protein